MQATLPSSPAHTDRAAVAAFFAEHGFYHARGVLDRTDVATLEGDFDRVVDQLVSSGEAINARWGNDTTTAIDGGGTEVIHTHQIQKYSAAWARMLFDDRVLDVAQAMLGPDIVMHHTKLFLKPAGRGAAFPPHQDVGYFPTVQNTMLAMNVMLTHADDSNGCLRIWPGSHKLGRIERSMGAHDEFAARFPMEGSIAMECEPGDLLFFSYLTVHASLPNRSDRQRKHVLVQLHSGQDRIESGGHPASNLVLRGWNHHMTRSAADCS
ncbi:MAG: phytanoyl-CoA dioxygenase family protein [Planctomycetes bacterium]|nr:phytanoyl-CoA dioxygenase family protein [Planctomycetota bacterium]